MSEPIPESIPVSADPRSQRPTKKRQLNAPASALAADQISALFARPEQEIRIPNSDGKRSGGGEYMPPETVQNVQGSSAGAGSGEFHVYKASRRREYERLRRMDEENRIEEETSVFENKRTERESKDEDKTRKNRERRMKKRKGRDGKPGGCEGQGNGVPKETAADEGDNGSAPKRRAVPHMVHPHRRADEASRTDVAADPTPVDEAHSGLIIHDDD